PEVVINAIASHHRDFAPTNLYSLIVLAADRLSAARPGARGYQSEAYIERMNSLENIANEFPGIKKSYAFQAGREVEKIKKEIVIPGEVVIQVVREKRFTQRLHHRPEPTKTKSRLKSFMGVY
ncbi:33629_t:CDS:2, partial [Racocetra persica]